MQNLGFRYRFPLQETLIIPFLSVPTHFNPKPYISFSQSRNRLLKTSTKNLISPPNINLRRLTSRIVDLTRRKQLNRIFEEVETAKRRYGWVNRIVMNAVMDACVRCKDLDSAFRAFDEMSKLESCGVDSVTYGILLKGLGEARRIDEAFQILESVEHGAAAGNPKLSPQLIYGLLNALLEAGDMRRANGLVARYRLMLHGDSHSIILYNLLMKGYTNTDFPLGALTVRDEITRQGLKPDKLTYNTLIFACVKSGKIDTAIQFLAEMKEEALKANCNDLLPDAVTYTTLLKTLSQKVAWKTEPKSVIVRAHDALVIHRHQLTWILEGLGNEKDLLTVQKIVVEMKSRSDLFIDRTAYTAIVDAFLTCGSIGGALCIYGEMIKQAGINKNLMPKPHLYLSMMRVFATRGDFDMVNKLQGHMWSDSVGSISPSARLEADELLMEAALNNNQIDIARQILSNTITKEGDFTWTSRGGMVAVRLEALLGYTSSLFTPYILSQVSLDDPIDKYMTAFEDAKPLPASLRLNKVVMRFLKDSIIPVIDDWGSCVGFVHREDCDEVDAPLSSLMRGPPTCVTTSTSVGRVMDLILEKKYQAVVVVRNNNVYETSYSSSSRPVGIFTRKKMLELAIVPEAKSVLCRTNSGLEYGAFTKPDKVGI